ncbi:hypothetical protein GWR56_04680 [Mucilaginibacter sp. 14171R-50]|uniref:hypothetical protein n=1 Tax=Mucilaginibacter sp. 14171R-50 TaxID=2703789 RepID=UPI00138D5FDC|nr:hypothetical protein [Mucilaginibacter sp. 14171R-50]QHS54877.1 hypothetical protein GWR56_04680 [Mucilaginibacter sp. 14171R-50]
MGYRYKIIVAPFLKVSGMALFPVILVNNKELLNDAVVINHERIHLKQQAELLVIPFYLLYLINYLVNLMIYHNHNVAYLNIIFEREAYANEADTHYIRYRRWYSWCRYFKLKQ